MQVISLTKNIKLLDSPGVVMSDNPSGTSLILKNCVKVCHSFNQLIIFAVVAETVLAP